MNQQIQPKIPAKISSTIPPKIQEVQPWYWRSLPLQKRTGSQVFAALFRNQNPSQNSPKIATLLESPAIKPAESQALARYSICAGPPRILQNQLQLWTPPLGEIFPFLQQLWQQIEARKKSKFGCHFAVLPSLLPDPSLPFTGGWLGWLGYDLAWEIEKLPQINPDPLPFPVAYWYEPAEFAVLDHTEQVLWLAASKPAELEQMERRLATIKPEKVEPSQKTHGFFTQLPPVNPHFQVNQGEYEQMVRQAKKYIQAGDIFQANLSLRFTAEINCNSWQIYQALQSINPSPFASYWQTPWGEMISCSPERLIKLHDQQAATRPIAGTRSRGVTPEQDRQLAEELLSNTKERAEHIMLVDLERNDLGRVCQWGSVLVDELLTIERYSHVMHLVSNAIGTLRPDCNGIDLIRAMFPGGTITGCPKVRCMEIIEELEPVRRSLFYGSCGYLDWRGNLDLNILIRTLLCTHGKPHTNCPIPAATIATSSPESTSRVFGQVGAGIVADSDPEKEWHESLHKAQAQLAALQIARISDPNT